MKKTMTRMTAAGFIFLASKISKKREKRGLFDEGNIE
jgi:hypothetical protein